MSNHSVLHTDGSAAFLRARHDAEAIRHILSVESKDVVGNVPSSQTGPAYYRRGHTQVWDFIREQELNFHLGNAIKYICRAGHKTSSKVEDLKKAIHYLTNELENTYPQTIGINNSGPRISEQVPSKEFHRPCYEDYAERLDC